MNTDPRLSVVSLLVAVLLRREIRGKFFWRHKEFC